MKTNKTNTINLPTIEDFNKIDEFSTAVTAANFQLVGLQNHFELLKRIGDSNLINEFGIALSKAHSNIITTFKSKLSYEDKD